MKARARIAATMAALGITPGDFNLLSRLGGNRRSVSKHAFNRTSRGAGRRSRCKLQMARGAGSINAKADILQLARQGKFLLAYDMAINHKRQCGEQLFPDYVLDAWMMEDIRPLTEQCP